MKSDIENGLSKPLTEYPEIKAKCKEGWPKHIRCLVYAVLVSLLLITIIGLIVRIVTFQITQETKLQEVPYKVLYQAPCEDGWIWNRGKCYYFSDSSLMWEESQGFCSLHNSSLAIIHNEVERKFLFRFKDADNHWIGLRWSRDNNNWIWINGTSYNFTLFQITRASPDAVEFAYLNKDGVKSQAGHYDNKFICSRDVY